MVQRNDSRPRKPIGAPRLPRETSVDSGGGESDSFTNGRRSPWLNQRIMFGEPYRIRVIIAGSRTITDMAEVEAAISETGLVPGDFECVVYGGANGVDKLGRQWAWFHRVPVKEFAAKWRGPDGRFHRSAGYDRNKHMVQYAAPHGALIAVWNGKSKGTASTIRLAKEAGLKVHVRRVESA